MMISKPGCVKLFKALGDENRIKIIELLQSGEKCGCVILERLDIGQSTLSHHMHILCESGIVKARRNGKWTHYSINEQNSKLLISILKELTTVNANDVCVCDNVLYSEMK